MSYSTEDEEVEDDIYIYIYISMHLYAGVWMSIGPLETLYIYIYTYINDVRLRPQPWLQMARTLVGESVAKFITLSPHVTALANYSGRAAQ